MVVILAPYYTITRADMERLIKLMEETKDPWIKKELTYIIKAAWGHGSEPLT